MYKMRDLLFVFLGGGAGSILRYMVSRWLNTSFFPWGTLAVNIIGCFLVSLFGTWIARQSLPTDLRLLMVVGLCGGFTTFSTFSSQAMHLFQSGQPMWGLAYMAASVLLSLLAVGFGLWMAAAIPFFGQQLPKP